MTHLAAPRPVPLVSLRPRQEEALKAVLRASSSGIGKQLVSLPTGVGKTMLAAHVSMHFERTLFLCHREELLEQSTRTYQRIAPLESIGYIYEGSHDIEGRITVGMIPTVYNRLSKIPPDTFDLVILDEAHHAAARTWRAVAEHFKPKLRLGLSATPERHDGAPLNDLFSHVTYEMKLEEAIREGLLVRPRALQVNTTVSLDNIKIVAGDFHEGELQVAVNDPRRNQLVVDTYLKHAVGRKGLAFCAGIDHAKDLAAAFQERGVRAAWVSGNDVDRKKKVFGFAGDELDMLTNAFVLTEGYDEPTIGVVLMTRPVKSRPLYAQTIGRGLRLHPESGKRDCLILDFLDLTKRHSLVTAWNFFGNSKQPKKPLTQPQDVLDPLHDKMAEAAERFQDLLGHPLDGAALIHMIVEVDLLKPPPEVPRFVDGTASWHLLPATDKQLLLLEEAGYSTVEPWTRGQASAIIGSLPPTAGQMKLLLGHGFDVLTHLWSRNQASEALNAMGEDRKPDWTILRRLEGKGGAASKAMA